MPNRPVLFTLDAVPASDPWGFVGLVRVGEAEAYRTIRAYPSPSEAVEAVHGLLAGVLGSLLAGQEWASASGESGHAALRSGLGLACMLRSDLGRDVGGDPGSDVGAETCDDAAQT